METISSLSLARRQPDVCLLNHTKQVYVLMGTYMMLSGVYGTELLDPLPILQTPVSDYNSQVNQAMLKVQDPYNLRATWAGDTTEWVIGAPNSLGYNPILCAFLNWNENLPVGEKSETTAVKNAAKSTAGEPQPIIIDTDGYDYNYPDNIAYKNIVITGQLAASGLRGERAKLEALIRQAGGMVQNAVNRRTDYIICNDPSSSTSKAKRGRALGIPFISDEDFLERFGIRVPVGIW